MGFLKKLGKIGGLLTATGGKFRKVLKPLAAPIAGAAATYFGGPLLGGMVSKLASGFGASSAASTGAAAPFVGPLEEGSPTQSINVTGSRASDPGFDWKGAVGALMPVASGVLNYIGQKNTNVANAEQAQRQMDFQNQQTSTSYQRGVSDMKAAGLNPMLAYSQGGASSGSGASATMGNELGAGANSALSAYQVRQQIEQSQAQIGNIQADTDLKDASIELTRNQALQTIANTRNLGTENARLVQDIARLGLGNQRDALMQDALVSRASSAADLTRAEAAAAKFGLGKSEAEHDWWRDKGKFSGGYYSPYRGAIHENINSASRASDAVRKWLPWE